MHAGRSSPLRSWKARGADKYDETAVAMIALLKYGTGVPFNRLEGLQEHLGMPPLLLRRRSGT